MSKIIKRFVKGWNGGLTGPNTPASPTVAMRIAERDYQRKAEEVQREGGSFRKYPDYPKTSDYYIPIACGDDTVGIAVGPDREENATLFANAPLYAEAMRLLESLTPYGSEFHNEPQRCHDFVRERLNTVVELAKERNALRLKVEALGKTLNAIAALAEGK